MDKRTLRLEVGEISLREEGIISARVAPNAKIALQDAKAFFNTIELLTNKEAHASVIDITSISRLDKDAREFMVNTCNEWGTTAAVAFVSNSIVSRLIGNLFLTVSRPNYPVRIFKDGAAAYSWAKTATLERYKPWHESNFSYSITLGESCLLTAFY